MRSALIVSNNEQGREFFTKALSENRYYDIVTVRSGGEARRILIERDFDLCIVNAPLNDENGVLLSRNIMTKGVSQVILVVGANYYDEISEKAEDVGIFTLSKPINKALFWNLLKLCSVSINRMQMIQKENQQLLQRIEDIRIIDRAKCILIEYLNMSEQEAHKHIERQAMDMRQSKRSIAENILKTYEN